MVTEINPFKDIKISALFTKEGIQSIAVEGFCDAQDGSVYKVRFMPRVAGQYKFELLMEGKKFKTQKLKGLFTAIKSARSGLISVDSENPTHFIYENSKKHYFWNSTTTYWMLGWKEEKVIRESIDRLSSNHINRIRVAINERAEG